MGKFFHGVFLGVLCLGAVAIPLRLESGSWLSINSSHAVDNFELVITATGKTNSHFDLFSEALSPELGQHTLTMDDEKVNITPTMNKQTILFNDYHDGQYWLGLQHRLKNKVKRKTYFLPIQVKQNENIHELLLPGLDLPLPFLPENSFYRCENLLISVQSNSSFSEVTVFSRNSDEFWSFQGDWSNKWRHSDNGLTYGHAERTHNNNDDIDIALSSGKLCKMRKKTADQIQNKVLNPQKYYYFHDLLEWATKVSSVPMMTFDEL